MSKENFSFFSEEIDFQLENSEIIADWIEQLILNNQKITGEITYIFCSDSYLLKMNQEHLNHDTLTDIITFDYSQAGIISGDIFISIDRIRDNSKDFKVNFEDELTRVMAHGILHLIGFNDKSEKEQSIMTEEENKAIALYNSFKKA